MYKSGLTSISFRKLSCEEIIELAKGKVDAIEWGSDVHVLPGNVERAREVAKMTRDAGMEVASYGSYYRAGSGDDFEALLDCAVAMGVATIRIWAGSEGSDVMSAENRKAVTEDIARITKLAAAKNITISSEYHRNTLTDNITSALQLIKDVRALGGETFFSYWQPAPWWSEETNKEELTKILPYLTNVHIYHWDSALKKYPIAEGKKIWGEYFDIIRTTPQDRYVYIEFVCDNDPVNFPADAAAVNEIIK